MSAESNHEFFRLPFKDIPGWGQAVDVFLDVPNSGLIPLCEDYET